MVSRSPDVSTEHQQLLRGFLRQADLVKFAHSIPATSVVEDSLAAAQRFLDETRENSPLLEEDAVAQRITATDATPHDASEGSSA